MSGAESGKKRLRGGDRDDGDNKRRAIKQSQPDEVEEDICYICFDAKHESGEPLRRDCSCRGGSGWAHLTCVVEYTKGISRGAVVRRTTGTDVNMMNFCKSWMFCQSCNQQYQNQLAIDLRGEFVDFVEREYQDDQYLLLNALYLKLCAFHSNFTGVASKSQQTTAKVIAHKMLSMIGKMRSEGFSPHALINTMEVNAYTSLGYIFLNEGTEESAKEAVQYYQKALIMDEDEYNSHQSNGSVDYARTSKAFILKRLLAHAKVLQQHVGVMESLPSEEELKQCRELYENYLKQIGQDSLATLGSGTNLARSLMMAGHGREAERLLTKLVTTSKRAHGINHSMTKQIESSLRFVNERIVMVKHKGEPKMFQALRYEDDGNKCFLKGPISMTGPRNVDEEETLTIESKEIIGFAPGTPVICNGLKLASVLNNKIGYVLGWSEFRSDIVRVRFEDKEQGTARIRAKFLRILFELPDEE